jgi:nicotinate-nucleotide adenylyltransferase
MTDPAVAVGVLGGTFDPVHVAHLAIADAVRRRLALDRILLVPAALPPHKRAGELSPAADRVAMLRLALADREGLEVCTLELAGDRVCYTIDTLRRLRDGALALCPVFILGSDSLLQIHTWREYLALLAEFDLAVVDRAGHELARSRREIPVEIARRLVVVPEAAADTGREGVPDAGRGGRVFHVPFAPVSISSSAIRELAARGEPLDGLVPQAVSAYIDRAGLYRQESAR